MSEEIKGTFVFKDKQKINWKKLKEAIKLDEKLDSTNYKTY